MSRPQAPEPVKLFASVLTGEHEVAESVFVQLQKRFGPIDYTSEALPFSFTAYYEKEIGSNLFRYLVSFRELVLPDLLPSAKLFTNSLEDMWVRADGTRRANIDPGYIALCHMVLATCKQFTHRPYLGRGVYADLTLLYQRGTFRPLEWTFPDYASRELIELLNSIRTVYFNQLRAG